MKKIKLLVEIEVPDNYRVDEPEWTLENAFLRDHEECIVNVSIIE